MKTNKRGVGNCWLIITIWNTKNKWKGIKKSKCNMQTKKTGKENSHKNDQDLTPSSQSSKEWSTYNKINTLSGWLHYLLTADSLLFRAKQLLVLWSNWFKFQLLPCYLPLFPHTLFKLHFSILFLIIKTKMHTAVYSLIKNHVYILPKQLFPSSLNPLLKHEHE